MARFEDVINDAMADFKRRGFTSDEQLATWMKRLKDAAESSLMPRAKMERKMREWLASIYKRMVDKRMVMRFNQGVSAYDLEKVRPQLRAELDRRILANVALIRINREEETAAMLRRFAGWATSIPVGGSKIDSKEDNRKIRKSLKSLSFRERRLMIDQGHKLEAAINETVSVGGGAIAAIWRSHWKQSGYDFRTEHKERALESATKPYVVRGNWALQQGLMKLDGSKYTDEMTKPGEEVYCRCYYQYIYNISELPESMLTAKGKAALAQARKAA